MAVLSVFDDASITIRISKRYCHRNRVEAMNDRQVIWHLANGRANPEIAFLAFAMQSAKFFRSICKPSDFIIRCRRRRARPWHFESSLVLGAKSYAIPIRTLGSLQKEAELARGRAPRPQMGRGLCQFTRDRVPQ